MDEDDQRGRSGKPAWFTPGRLLAIFCATNLIVYLDRGLIASNGVNGSPRSEELPQGSGIQGEFGLTNTQDGFLATAFLVGLLLASPVFSESCKHTSAFRLIGAGMATWAAATAGCGLARGFWSLLLCRAAVGVGEASFVALAAPFIDDYAPPARKARWFAAFYLCIPVGFAAGYIFGGVVAGALGWRAAFLIESAAVLPFVAFCFISRPLHLAGSHDSGPDPSAPKSLRAVAAELGRDAAAVASHGAWRRMVGGYVLYTAVLGVYAFWGPKAGKAIYDMPGESADVIFGGVTVLTGVLGSLGGGAALDAAGATLANANLLCGVSNLVGLGFVLSAFCLARNFAAFIALFAAGELALFTLQAPVGAIGMWSVPPPLRPLAISLTTVAIHLLGDVPSPPLLGALQSALEAAAPPGGADAQWRVSMSLVSLLLAGSGAVFLHAARAARTAPDYRRGEERAAAAAAAEAHHLGGGGGGQPGHRRRGSAGSGGGGGGGSGALGYSEGVLGGSGLLVGSAGAAPGAGLLLGGGNGDRQPLLDPEEGSPGDSAGASPQPRRLT
ncbi:sphingolipid transporter spinster 2 [Scenedesmus sp. PABB004]|nr:sphingolipid transporter spinster 2 [Scenedesmus sp. PABB004]